LIYLDYAADTPADERVLSCFCDRYRNFSANPNSQHSMGTLAKTELDRLTKSIAALLGVLPSEIIYTSGASEANNLALKGLAKSQRNMGKHIVSTCLEHSSVSGTLTALQEQGYEIELVDINRDGTVDLAHLKELLRKDTVIVSVCMVDSELGTVQPIDAIGEILTNHPNCRFHVDATQAVGKIPVHFKGVDCMSFAPHKFYGLNSCGVLIKRDGVVLEPLIHGGLSATVYRSGTPDLPMIAATETALTLALEQLPSRHDYVSALYQTIKSKLSAYCHVTINSPDKGTPFILNVSIKGVKGEDFRSALDKKGVCISTKSACSAPNTPSRPVYAISKDRKNALSSWRISLSHLTTENEVRDFLTIFEQCYGELTT